MSSASSSAGQSGFGTRDWIVLTAMTIVWGLNIIFVKLSVDAIAPMTAAFLRQSMIALACLPFLRVVPGRMAAIVTLSLVVGVLFYLPMNYALAMAKNVSALAIASQLSVPFAVILSVLFLGERIGLPRIMGIVMAFSGVLLLGVDPGIVHELPAIGLASISAFVWAAGSLLTRRLPDVPVPVLFAWFGVVGSVTLGTISIIVEPAAMAGVGHLPWQAFGAVAFSALGSSLIGHGGLAWLVQRHPIALVMPYTLIAPVLSVIVAALAFGTPVTGLMLLGGVIVLAGVAIITLRSAQKGVMIEDMQ
ncbi:DMT family transporter [Sphingobium aromaticiconvertens]|uniref:DMT family transporter n=1 Tax=Sphingobium aromaticiconvertens TaxID=365341 RepID=UPI00301A98A5